MVHGLVSEEEFRFLSFHSSFCKARKWLLTHSALGDFVGAMKKQL